MKNAETLEITTPTEREIVMTRVFDAPRQLVFDAWTKPELVKRWLLGPDGWTMPVCEIDLRVGGKYRWVWRRDKDGTQMGIGGIYREVAAPERLVATERFDEAWYPGEAVNTVSLVEQGGRTTMTQTTLYESRDARDKALQSGMADGVRASYDRLEALLAEGR
ncbi:MAG TPA: SRPBCC family protein [Vicinamibacteria bacterium]|nr:SRPBCC family protein [Vicinamibacteria bacterium]